MPLPSAAAPIRVLLVDDSPLVLTVLTRMLSTAPDIEIVGTANNGEEALVLVARLRPTVICTDYHMPVMDGLELVKVVMAQYPCPILVISGTVGPDNPDRIFELLQAGAVDVFPKPTGGWGADDESTRQIVSKIKILAGVIVFKRSATGLSTQVKSKLVAALVPIRVVAIGASTGGPQAFHQILRELPQNFPCPVLCVQHISEGFLRGLVEWLAGQCKLFVKIAASGEEPQPGIVYFPQEGTHLTIDSKGRLSSSTAPPFEGHRPAVGALFDSVAGYYGSSAIAVLLTGMGSDGAEGMRAVARAGGVTVAQDEKSSVIFGMPKQAIEMGVVRYVLPLSEISAQLVKCAAGNKD